MREASMSGTGNKEVPTLFYALNIYQKPCTSIGDIRCANDTTYTMSMFDSVFKKCTLGLMSALCLSSCCSETPIPEILNSYQEYHQPKVDVEKGYNAYFDLSDGLLSAYQVEATSNCLKSVVNKVTGNASCQEVLTLKNSQIEKNELRQTELYNYIMDAKSYQMIAPIEESLKQITAGNKAALLVTDFEEYNEGQIQQQNFAKKYFIDWLNKGNNIVFYVFDYTENGKPKHLYFTIFDTADHTLLSETDDALKGNGANYQVFRLNNGQVLYTNNYPAVTRGGIYRYTNGDDPICGLVETGEGDCYTIYKDYASELYVFEESWENMVQNVRDIQDPANVDSSEPKFQHLISGVTANFERMSGYNVKKLDIKITDIQSDYDKFAGYYAFKTNGDNADDDGKVVKEFDYPNMQITNGQIEDMFVFGGKVQGKKAEIALDFRPQFGGVVANMPPTDLIRVDVVIADCEPNYDILPALFEWPGNTSMIQAVKNTLQDQNPIGKVIYTYFLKSTIE